MPTPLTIWTNVRLSKDSGVDALAERLARETGHEIVRGDEALAHADVAFGAPSLEALLAAKKLRWVQVTAAGYTAYDRPEVWASLKARGIAFTNSSSAINDACAQHLLAMMLGLARRLPECVERQRGPRHWSEGHLRAGMHVLTGSSAILYGYGAIARRLVSLLRPFRMDLLGVRRQIRSDETMLVVTPDQADLRLARFDHVVNILPANDSSAAFFDARRFAVMKPGAFFYNIGRGTTVRQADLIAALHSGQLAAAYLDVTDPEPLPKDQPLWDAPNCWITPHTGGGRHDEREHIIRHFLENLQRFQNGEPLRDRVV